MLTQVAVLDLGVTKLLAGLVDESGALLATLTAPTPEEGGPQAVVRTAAQLLRDLDGKPMALGVTLQGLTDTPNRIVRSAPALNWRNVPLATMLAEATGLEARIVNDLHACALAEQRFGAGRGARSLFWITVSIGVGGALVLDGKVVAGARGSAGEIGHIVVAENGELCGCGQQGCLEAMVGGPAIAKRAGMANAAQVFEAARQGNPAAKTVVAETAFYLGSAVAVVQNLIDPEIVVFGGSVGRSLDLLLPGLERAVRQRAFLGPSEAPVLRATTFGYEAGLMGAACLVLSARSG